MWFSVEQISFFKQPQSDTFGFYFSLSSAAPEVTSPAATSMQNQAADEAEASTSVTLDPSQPLTNIQIRLADGTRLIQRFNHTHRWLLIAPINLRMHFNIVYKADLTMLCLKFKLWAFAVSLLLVLPFFWLCLDFVTYTFYFPTRMCWGRLLLSLVGVIVVKSSNALKHLPRGSILRFPWPRTLLDAQLCNVIFIFDIARWTGNVSSKLTPTGYGNQMANIEKQKQARS